MNLLKKLTGALILISCVTSIAAPKAVLTSKNDIQLGKFNKGETRKAVFTIKNSGDEKLIFTKVRSSCGCASALLDPMELKPGETSTLTVTVTGGKELYGAFIKSVYLASNDPKQQVLKCSFFGNVLTKSEK